MCFVVFADVVDSIFGSCRSNRLLPTIGMGLDVRGDRVNEITVCIVQDTCPENREHI